MKLHRCLVLLGRLLLLLVACFSAGCSALLCRSGKPLDRFQGQPGCDTRPPLRAEVLRQLGQPVSTRVLHPPKTFRQLAAEGVILSPPPRPNSNGITRLDRVDEFRFRGKVFTRSDRFAYGIYLGAAQWTLGVSEILFFPMALSDCIQQRRRVTSLVVLYAPNDEFAFGRVIEHRKPQ
jgi:hypothetical protein